MHDANGIYICIRTRTPDTVQAMKRQKEGGCYEGGEVGPWGTVGAWGYPVGFHSVSSCKGIAKADELPVFITARGRKIRNSEPGGGCFQWAPTPNPLPLGEGGGRYCHNIALCSGHCIDIDICDRAAVVV